MYDFHTHTFLSDGVLSPIELIRRAMTVGYRVMAITDHVNVGNVELVVKTLVQDCKLASDRWDILALPGVEITHVPKEDIDMVARDSKQWGARIVVVHGETIVEPVESGTNRAAISSPHVDILAHPGLIELEDAYLAAEKKVYLEITARRGHSLTNGHVAKIANLAGARIILDSDAHEPQDLLNVQLAESIARGAGLETAETHTLLWHNPTLLLQKLGVSP
jgi:putative hydrolase